MFVFTKWDIIAGYLIIWSNPHRLEIFCYMLPSKRMIIKTVHGTEERLLYYLKKYENIINGLLRLQPFNHFNFQKGGRKKVQKTQEKNVFILNLVWLIYCFAFVVFQKANEWIFIKISNLFAILKNTFSNDENAFCFGLSHYFRWYCSNHNEDSHTRLI